MKSQRDGPKLRDRKGRAGDQARASQGPSSVPASSAKLDLIFSALSNSTRREMLARLARGESTVTELAEPFEMSLPAISKHLHVLEEAELVSKVKDGRTYRCHLDPVPLAQAERWMNFHRALWERQLSSLSDYLKPRDDEGR